MPLPERTAQPQSMLPAPAVAVKEATLDGGGVLGLKPIGTDVARRALGPAGTPLLLGRTRRLPSRVKLEFFFLFLALFFGHESRFSP